MNLSVVIPTLNEASLMRHSLDGIRREHAGELFVVDGGSEDTTADEAGRAGATVIASPRGLARQCNAGAAASSGDVLLFLAADTTLERGWHEGLTRALRLPHCTHGGFELSFGNERWIYPVLAWGGNIRSRCMQMFLADQGLFVRRKSFIECGGMPEGSLIPFAGLCQKLNKLGEGSFLRQRAFSSPRKYETGGVVQTVCKHARAYFRFLYSEPG